MNSEIEPHPPTQTWQTREIARLSADLRAVQKDRDRLLGEVRQLRALVPELDRYLSARLVDPNDQAFELLGKLRRI